MDKLVKIKGIIGIILIMTGIAAVLSSSLVTRRDLVDIGTIKINEMVLDSQSFLLFVGIALLSIGTWLIAKAFK